MPYVMIEGQISKSEGAFWKVLKEHKFNKIEEVIGTDGSGKMASHVLTACKKCKDQWSSTGQTEHILICLDTTARKSDYEAVRNNLRLAFSYTARALNSDIVKDPKHFCKLVVNGYEHPWLIVDLAPFYCFEDCLLFFTDLEKWAYSTSRRSSSTLYDKLNLLKEYRLLNVGKSIKENEWKNNQVVMQWMIKHCTTNNNFEFTSREKVGGHLLEYLTSKEYFKTNKGNLSGCWSCDCTKTTSYDLKLDKAGQMQLIKKKTAGCMYCPHQNRMVDFWNRVIQNGLEISGNLINEEKFLLSKECGLFDLKNRLTTQQKIDDLINKSPILKYIYDHYKWLYE